MFVEKAIVVHGDKYDYSYVDYKFNNLRATRCNSIMQYLDKSLTHAAQKKKKKND